MLRIGFIGVPGAGKTSTARALAAICRRNHRLKNVELVSEYARRYIAKYGPVQEPWEQIRIFQKQLEWERSVSYADLVITDSPLHLGWGYAMELIRHDGQSFHGVKGIMCLNDLTSMLMKIDHPEPRYDIIFHLPPVIKPVDDGVRASHQLDDGWRYRFDKRLTGIFTIFQPKRFITLDSVDLERRAEEALGHINNFMGPAVLPPLVKETPNGNQPAS